MARVPRGLGRGDGSTAQWGRAAGGLLRGPVAQPRRPRGDRRGGLAGVRGCGVGGCAGRAQPWTPAAPGLAVAVEWPSVDDVWVEVLTDDGDPRVAAAIELVSPRNKDRPRAREAFAAKCADYLGRGCCVVVVDVVTTRRADLQADLLAMLGADPAVEASAALSAVSYRPVVRDGDGQLHGWPVALEVGRLLPTVPLWLGADLAVPLDLEASHSAACVDLRIRQAG